jgi:RimJ/RimL family protein N-acetyltransferase
VAGLFLSHPRDTGRAASIGTYGVISCSVSWSISENGTRFRGLGIGRRLVEECIRFARLAGYRRMILWTANHLLAARTIYARCGFQLVKSEPDSRFSAEFVSETWELDLTCGADTN